MENIIFIKDRKVYVKPLRSRIEAILKLEPSKMPKGCRSFAGMVNYLVWIVWNYKNFSNPFMFYQEKVDHLYGKKNNRKHLRKHRGDKYRLQYYICPIDRVDFIYILIPVSLQQVAHYIKFKMASQCDTHEIQGKSRESVGIS